MKEFMLVERTQCWCYWRATDDDQRRRVRFYIQIYGGQKKGRKEDCNVDETKKFVDEGSQKACRVNSSVIRDLHVDEFRGKIEKEKNREDWKQNYKHEQIKKYIEQRKGLNTEMIVCVCVCELKERERMIERES